MKLLGILLLVARCGLIMSQLTQYQYCSLWDSIKHQASLHKTSDVVLKNTTMKVDRQSDMIKQILERVSTSQNNVNESNMNVIMAKLDQKMSLIDAMDYTLNRQSALFEELSQQMNDSYKYITCKLESQAVNLQNMQLLKENRMCNNTLQNITASKINLEEEQQAQQEEILSLRNQSQNLIKSLADVTASMRNLEKEKQDEIVQNKFLAESKQILEKISKELNDEIKCLRNKDKGKFFDCAELYKSGERSNGVYNVYLQDTSTNCKKHVLALYCDMTTSGGGWTVFQRRYDGSVLFNNTWEEYKNGFGSSQGEHWLGNKYLHMMTKSLKTKFRLRIDLTSFGGDTSYAEYTNFKVASETEKYRITFGTYSGTAGDSFSYHKNRFFSTRDRDNDQNSYTCSQSSGYGGFWYGACHDVNLNGVYRNDPKRAYTGMVWDKWIYNQVMQATSMKFRPMNFP